MTDIAISANAKTATNRYKWVDYARGISILLVVYRHVFEGLKRNGANVADYSFLETMNLFFFSFRMPLFFVIAGFFVQAGFGKRGVGGYIKHRASTILYPFVLWGFIQISLQLLFSGVTNSQRTLSDYWHLFIFPREIDQFWYLLALFNVSSLYVIASQRLRGNQQLIAGLILYSMGMIVDYFGWSIGFVYDVLHYYLFLAIGEFVAGYLFRPATLQRMSSTKFALFGLPVFAAVQYLFLYLNHRHNSMIYVEKYLGVIFLFIALAGVFYVLGVSMFLARVFKESWLSFVGRHSLQIYVLHVIVSSACRTILTKYFGIESFPLLLILCITVAVVIPILIETTANKLGVPYLFSVVKNENIGNLPKPKASGRVLSESVHQ